jgi:branched-chain amino acid transport system substrate-binding protein
MDDSTQVGRPWRVGVLFSETGVTAAVERTQLQATLLAIDEINATGGVLDLPLEPVRYDPESNPKRFRDLAEQLLGVDRVRLVFGCYMSSSRKAVLPVIEAHRALLFYPTLYEGFEYSRHCIYTGAAPNQNSLQLARFLFEHYGNRFLLVGSNYVYPYESNRVMTDLVRQNHGKIVNEIYVPLNAREADFSRTIQEIKKTSPDVIFSTVVGTGTAAFYQAYRAAGFDPARQPIASLTTSEAEVAEMAAETAEGHITAAPFFETLGTPAARRFVTAYKQRYGTDAPIPAAAEAAYFQVHLAAAAIARRQRRPRTRAAGAMRDRVRGAAGARADRPREQPHLSLASGRAPRRPA